MDNYKWYFRITSFILCLILISNVLQTIYYHKDKTVQFKKSQVCYETQSKKLQELSIKTNNYIADTVSKYGKDVYDNPKVDRIAEQQLISSEYSLIALQYLIGQNVEILDIVVGLSVCDSYKW